MLLEILLKDLDFPLYTIRGKCVASRVFLLSQLWIINYYVKRVVFSY